MGSSLSTDARSYATYQRMSFDDKLKFRFVHFCDQYLPWHKLPLVFAAVYLYIRRSLHQKYNLLPVGDAPARRTPAEIFRTADGHDVDSNDADSGAAGTFFGRNGLPPAENEPLLDPHPSIIATKLLARKGDDYIDSGDQFNMLAASWIQFMIHDWVDHLEDTKQIEVTAPESVAAQCPLRAFKFFATKEENTGDKIIKVGHRNTRTSWWDGSVIYGSNKEAQRKVRTFKDGKLKVDEITGLLEHNEQGVAVSGDVKNTWAGVSVLQALFVKEHNAVCDALKAAHPEFGDEKLFQHARLVVAAVIAKVHTIDWTVELLKTRTLDLGMHANWYGLLGKRFKSWFGHTGISLLSGYIGMSKPDDHGVPYSLTEDFVAVYRLHPLLPEEVLLRNINQEPEDPKKKIPVAGKKIPMLELIGTGGERMLNMIGNEKMIVSMGHQSCGALTLFNYPYWMRNIPATNMDGTDRQDHIDLPALEIYRDRERSIPKYNDFRRNLLMIPVKTWKDLTNDDQTIKILQEVYGDDVERLDLLVGLLAEKKIKGFAISETAFFIFLLMASRRLEADPFFTEHFNSKTYTKEGLAWVNNTESLKDVLHRHHPNITANWLNAASAFSVWSSS